MNRVINIKLCGNYLSKDNKIAGVRGEANVTKLRITFDEGWDGYAKKITFWDAHGTNSVKRIFTTDCIEDILKDSRTYLIPIPHEPMAEAGMLTFVIDGYVDDKRQRSVSDKLEVKDAPMEDDADNPIDPTPTQAEQLQVQIDTIINDIQSAVEAKEDIENMTISYESLLEEESNNRIYADSSLNERINKIKYYGDADIEISPDEWFVFNDEEHTILGGLSEGHENETSIVIPYSVTTIGPEAFTHCESLTNVTIPNSVTSISSSAFSYCESLTNITIPDSVIEILGDGCCYCRSLTSITIGSGLKKIATSAFEGCISLTNIVVSSNNKYFSSLDNVIFSEDKTKLILYPQGKNDEQYIIPDSVTSIGDYAFHNCHNLKIVKMCDNVTELSRGAFAGSINLESVELSNKITNINRAAFFSCSSLKSVTIPNSVTDLGMSAFGGCDSLTDIYYDGTLEEWNAINDTFSGIDDLTKIHTLIAKGTCGDNLTWTLNEDYELVIDGTGDMDDYDIYSTPFYKLRIDKVVIKNGVTNIGSGLFAQKDLLSVTIPNSVTKIGDYAFYICHALSSVTIPDGVTSIGNDAFLACSSLTSITIPDSVTYISGNVFLECNNLTIYCSQGSYADTFAREYNIPVRYPDVSIDKTITENSENAVSSGAVFEAVSEMNNSIDEALLIARGRSSGYVFDTLADLDAWLDEPANTYRLVVGDNLYIRAIDVPDYWWDGVQKQQLETQKVDLSEYYTKNEISTKIDEVSDIADESKSDSLQAISTSETANTTAQQAKANADNAIEIAQSVRADADNGVFNGKDGADYIITEADKEEIKSDVVETLTRSSTALPEMLDVNTIYDLGEQDALTLNLPAGKLGDFIEVDFLSTQTPTTLTITASSGISDYNLIPDANTIYSLYFNWIRLDAENYGWGFGYAEYTRTVA